MITANESDYGNIMITYSPLYAWSFVTIHCIGGFYLGFMMTCMNVVGRPLFERVMSDQNTDEFYKSLGDSF